MLQRLATICTGTTRNEQVRRNLARFPADFMFQLTAEEVTGLRSQIATSNVGRGGRRYAPYAFTEHGAIMAATILNSPLAVEMSVYVVRAFVQLRDMLASNKELARRLDELERKLASHDQAITGILKAIRELMSPTPEPKRRGIGLRLISTRSSFNGPLQPAESWPWMHTGVEIASNNPIDRHFRSFLDRYASVSEQSVGTRSIAPDRIVDVLCATFACHCTIEAATGPRPASLSDQFHKLCCGRRPCATMAFLDFFRGSSAERIARQYIRALRDAGEARRLEYEEQSNLVVVLDEQGNRVQVRFLGNLIREIKSAQPADHAGIYHRHVLSAFDVARERLPSYELVRPTLRILLKDSSYPDYIALQNLADFPDSTSSPLVFEPLVGDVIACCVEERGQSLRFVTTADLASWQVSSATALADARANVCGLPFVVSDPNPARYVFNDDSYQAARLVNPRMFDGLPVQGNWVAVVPDRDTFFLADSEDLEAVAGLARLAQQQLEAGERIISGLPFVLRGGSWHVYDPPAEIRSLFSNVSLQYRKAHWRDYKAVLERDLAARGQDIFVANLTAYEEAGVDTHYCMAVWSKGVDTILPVVDRIYFHDSDLDVTRTASWGDVARVMGASMQREAGLPEHYLVQSFPNSEQLAAMGARVV